MREWAGQPSPRRPLPPEMKFPALTEEQVRRLAWEKCGIQRSGEGLLAACNELRQTRTTTCAEPHRTLFEVRNMREVVFLIACCALARRESRGAHYRIDCPRKSPEFLKHSLITRTNEVTFF